jgi:two-component system response regulator TtrR
VTTSKEKTKVFVLDDDSCILDAACIHLKDAGFDCTCFSKPQQCLDELSRKSCDLLITDVRMPEKDGIEVLIEAKKNLPWLPVLVVTSFGDIPLAVKAVKNGAIDFVEKPLDWPIVLKLIRSTLEEDQFAEVLKCKTLTKAEVVVLKLILKGKTSKEIANELHRSVRTVEVHRSHIMHKLKAENVVELVKKAAALGIEQEKE